MPDFLINIKRGRFDPHVKKKILNPEREHPLSLQSLPNAQSLKFTNPNPIRAKSTNQTSHHQPPLLSAVTTSDCHPRFLKVFSPPRVIKPEGAVKPEPVLVAVEPEGAVKPRPVLVAVESKGVVIAAKRFCYSTSRAFIQPYFPRRGKRACLAIFSSPSPPFHCLAITSLHII
ncbi:hypothetical protein AHAS_Ahas17G0131600 [Arachis hypogaea]